MSECVTVLLWSYGGIVIIVTRLQAGESQDTFTFSVLTLVLRPPQPPVWWVLGCVHQCDVFWAVHSPPFSAKVKNERNYTFTTPYVFFACTRTALPLQHFSRVDIGVTR
jgi:hypothetical protein